MTDQRFPMSCEEADALAGALGFDALERDEAAPVREHLATCPQPHAELRGAPGAGAALAAILEPVSPSPELRARIMRSIGDAPATAPVRDAPEAGRSRWWWLPRAAVGFSAAAVVALAAWNVQLQGQLDERQAEVRQVAAALSGGGVAHAVSGPAGGGVVIEGESGTFLVADVARPEDERIYEMWLIDAGGAPVAVGTFRPAGDGLVVVELERPIGSATTFAVTIEERRVEAPTGDPVLVAPLGS